MKQRLLLWLAIGVVLMMPPIACADVSLCAKPAIPENLWEKFPDGTTVAFGLTNRTEVGGTKKIRCLAVFISAGSKGFCFDTNYDDQGIRVFYLQDHKSIALRQYSDEIPWIENHHLAPARLGSGQTLMVTIDLGEKELSLLRSHPVKCSMKIYDVSSMGKFIKVETSPKSLTEIPDV